MYARKRYDARKSFEKMQRRTSNSCGTAPELRNNSVLREQTADEGGFGHTSDGENHGAGARRNVMFAHRFNHFMKSAHDRFLQAGVHFFRVPDQPLLVLHPLKIADRDTAGIREDVWKDGDSLASENFIGVGRRRSVGGFGDYAGLDRLGVVQGDDVFESSGHQDVAFHVEQLVVGSARSAGHAYYRAAAFFVANGFDGVDATRIGYASASITKGDDFGFFLGKELRDSGS